jgi:hypothetical protein
VACGVGLHGFGVASCGPNYASRNPSCAIPARSATGHGVRGKNRLITRAMSSWAYWAADDDGNPRYSGARYLSRVLPNEECWAVFDGTDIVENGRQSIQLNNPELRQVADMWGLRPF